MCRVASRDRANPSSVESPGPTSGRQTSFLKQAHPPPKQSLLLTVTGAFKNDEVAAKSETVFSSRAEVSGDVERTLVSRARSHKFGGPSWVIGSERLKRRKGAKSENSWRKGFKGVDERFLGKERHEMTCSSDEKRRLRWWQGFGDEDEDRGQDLGCARCVAGGWNDSSGQDRASGGKRSRVEGTRDEGLCNRKAQLARTEATGARKDGNWLSTKTEMPTSQRFPPKEAMRVCNNPGQVTTAERESDEGGKQAPAGCSVSCLGPGARWSVRAFDRPVTCAWCAWGAWGGSDGAAFATVYCIPSWNLVGLLLLGSRDKTHNADQRSSAKRRSRSRIRSRIPAEQRWTAFASSEPSRGWWKGARRF